MTAASHIPLLRELLPPPMFGPLPRGSCGAREEAEFHACATGEKEEEGRSRRSRSSCRRSSYVATSHMPVYVEYLHNSEVVLLQYTQLQSCILRQKSNHAISTAISGSKAPCCAVEFTGTDRTVRRTVTHRSFWRYLFLQLCLGRYSTVLH